MAANLTFDILARDKASATLDKVSGRFDGVARKMKGLAVLGGAALGAGIVKFGRDSVAAFKESEDAQNRLSDAFSKFPKLADINQQSLAAYNEELAKKTKFDDDATASGQAVLAQFDLTGKQITELTPLLQDYAAKTGKDLPTAAQDLGKAMLGQGRALKAVGIDFQDTGSVGSNFEQIMGGLRTQVGGFAEKEGKTAAGQSKILSNQFGELQEQVGAKLVPILQKLTAVGLAVIGFIQKNISWLGPLAAGIGAVIAVVKIWTAVQWALTASLLANPIGLVIALLVGLAAGLVVAYRRSETFRNIVQGAMRGVQTAFGWVVDAGAAVIAWFRNLPGAVGRAVSGIASVITSPFRSAFNAVRSLWNNTVGGFRFEVPSWIPGLGGKGFSIPKMAEGGIIRARQGGTLALLGEGGRDEAVVPLSRGGFQSTSAGGGDVYVTVNVQGSVRADRDLARTIRDELQRMGGRGDRMVTA